MQTVAVLGGGITGLTAAYRLSQKGYKVTIFEKSEAIGGLAAGFEFSNSNLEKAYHHLFKSDSDIIELCKELDIIDKLHFYNSSVAIYTNNKLYPFATAKDLLKFSPLNILDRLRAGFVIFYLQHTYNWQKFSNITAKEFMKKWSGKRPYKVIWEPLLKGKFSKYYDKISMAWLWSRISIRANSKSGQLEQLGYFDGGFNTLIQAIKKQLEKFSVEINLESQIQSIKNTHNKVELKTKNGTFKFDAVLSTLPSNVFSKLIVEDSKKIKDYILKLESINYIGAIINVFSYPKSLSNYYWHNINDTSFPFLVFIEHTNLIDKSNYGNNYIYYIATYVPHDHKYFSIEDGRIKDEWYLYLKKMFPEFDMFKIKDNNLFKFKFAQHIVDTSYPNKIPDYKTPLRNVYLANFSQIYPEDRGTNYAVKEGNKIAELIDKDLKLVNK